MAPFDISEQCCKVMKKEPFKRYNKMTGRVPYIAVTQDEGFQRAHQYAHTGCNIYDAKTVKSQPLGFWTKQDILRYVVENDVEICSIYGDICQHSDRSFFLTGEQRTGCMFCGFGVHMEKEPNRFQRMQLSHPRCYELCMRSVDQGGLGMTLPLDYMDIPYTTWEAEGQLSMKDLYKDWIGEKDVQR